MSSPCTSAQRQALLDPDVEQARAFSAVAFMIAGSLEVACRMAKPIDAQLHRALSDAWARALEVMTEQRSRWRDLRREQLREDAP